MTSARRVYEHPAVVGRADEMARLADEVRRLVALCVTNTAPADVTAEAAARLREAADLLEPHVPDPPLPRTNLAAPDDHEGDMVGRMPFDVVVGRYHPIALPLQVSWDPPRALAEGCFTTPYEGPPGCVHGAVIAASFDIVLTAANWLAGVPGPTALLSVRYRRPTLLHTPALFEAEVTERSGRRVVTQGRLVQDGEVRVEAQGEFVVLSREDTMRLVHRRKRDGSERA